VEHWHTRTKTGVVKALQTLSPRAWLEMNPRDAKRLKLKPHDRVSVVSQRSRVDGIELRVTEIVAPGQIFMPFHFVETNSNLVTQSAFDPISREPNFKQCAVQVERTVAPAFRPAAGLPAGAESYAGPRAGQKTGGSPKGLTPQGNQSWKS
jgi:assimilatory nitrate reductase catalytic subunit